MKKQMVRTRIREDAWRMFCLRDHRHLPDDQVVKIIFNKAQKTYLRYVSLYQRNEHSNIERIAIANCISQLLTFASTYWPVIERTGIHAEYKALLDDMQILCDSLWSDYYQQEKSRLQSAA